VRTARILQRKTLTRAKPATQKEFQTLVHGARILQRKTLNSLARFVERNTRRHPSGGGFTVTCISHNHATLFLRGFAAAASLLGRFFIRFCNWANRVAGARTLFFVFRGWLRFFVIIARVDSRDVVGLAIRERWPEMGTPAETGALLGHGK